MNIYLSTGRKVDVKPPSQANIEEAALLKKDAIEKWGGELGTFSRSVACLHCQCEVLFGKENTDGLP